MNFWKNLSMKKKIFLGAVVFILFLGFLGAVGVLPGPESFGGIGDGGN